jgi:hypothetical protein
MAPTINQWGTPKSHFAKPYDGFYEKEEVAPNA